MNSAKSIQSEICNLALMADRLLFILAGCNGAGKTTATHTLLPDLLPCLEFVNADEIASEISPFQPDLVAVQAGRIMLQRMEYLTVQGKTFAFETTLSGARKTSNNQLFISDIEKFKTMKTLLS